MKNLKLKSRITAIFLLIVNFIHSQAGFGELRGTVKNNEQEPVPFATVKILQGNLLIGGTQSDAEGNYKYKPLSPGIYELIIIESGHRTIKLNGIEVAPDNATYVNPIMAINSMTEIIVVAKPVEIDYTKSGVDNTMYIMTSITGKDLMQSAGFSGGNITGVIATLASDVLETGDGELHFRGGRGNAMGYFVDGVKCLGPNTISGLAIENLTFFSGGVPAMYGDLTSGAVMVTTKSYFSGLREKNVRNYRYNAKRKQSNTN
jgi:hypothetical protein